MAFISVGAHSAPINDCLEDFGVERLIDLNAMDIFGKTKVFVNGNWIGIHPDAEYLTASIKNMRRNLDIPKEVSIVKDSQNKEIRIYTDPGRVQRPLFIVEDNKLRIKKEKI